MLWYGEEHNRRGINSGVLQTFSSQSFFKVKKKKDKIIIYHGCLIGKRKWISKINVYQKISVYQKSILILKKKKMWPTNFKLRTREKNYLKKNY